VGRVNKHGDAAIDAKEILDHSQIFRGQLVESLRHLRSDADEAAIPGTLDTKLAPSRSALKRSRTPARNTVRRVVRTGWYLNGQSAAPRRSDVGKSKG
jgi:hypothetical protein